LWQCVSGASGCERRSAREPTMEASITSAVMLPADMVLQLSKQKRVQRINNEHFFRVHPELRTMVSSFISELLKAKPDNVDLFAESYFCQPDLAAQLGYHGWTRPPTPEPEEEVLVDDDFGAEEEAVGTTDMDPLELEQLLIGLFKEADQDESGFLDFKEFAQLMSTSDIGLSKNELEYLLAEADENQDGQVTYQEFVPLAVEVIQTMRLKQRVDEEEAELAEVFRDAAIDIIGMQAEEVEALVVQKAKACGDGSALTRPELKALLKSPQLGLSKHQASMASNNVDFDAEGKVAVVELAPNMYEILIVAIGKGLASQNLGQMGEEIEMICDFYDKESTGFLDPRVLKAALAQNCEFLSQLQLNSLISDPVVPTNGEGQIAWREYLPRLTALIKAMGDPAAIHEKSEMAARAEFQPAELMSVKEQAQFEEMLKGLFAQADTDGDGELDMAEFRECMIQADFGLSPAEIDDLFNLFDTDASGTLSLEEFIVSGYDVMSDMARERAIMNAMYEANMAAQADIFG